MNRLVPVRNGNEHTQHTGENEDMTCICKIPGKIAILIGPTRNRCYSRDTFGRHLMHIRGSFKTPSDEF